MSITIPSWLCRHEPLPAKTPLVRSFSNSSELSDTPDSMEHTSSASHASQAETSALEEVDGCQPELQKSPRESELSRITFQHEYLGSGDRLRTVESLLGPLPNAPLFKNKCFLLTCTIPSKRAAAASSTSTTPFFKDHLRQQIEAGGGTVYKHFEDVPTAKYRFCKLVAAESCVTAKYVQCLAADIKAISHDYIIECCRREQLVDVRRFLLPAGWSHSASRLIRWQTGRAEDQRHNAVPLKGVTIMVASDCIEFETFWTRVCEMAQASVMMVMSTHDISGPTGGYFLTDAEFSGEVKAKAEHFRIPVVSTVWVVECLVTGALCAPDAHEKFREPFHDDFF